MNVDTFMNISWKRNMVAHIKFLWKGHIANWVWKDSQTRRLKRQHQYEIMIQTCLEKYIPFVKKLHANDNKEMSTPFAKEKFFTLWFQGKGNMPEIVTKCISSIERMYPNQLIVLDNSTMMNYIEIPDYIIKKWDEKQIGSANFSDIVRIELLSHYGGYWFDATDFIINPIPKEITDSNFFMYMTSRNSNIHMFVQTCFIRAKKGDPLIKMWRDLVFEYWKNEKKAICYFLVHQLFKLLVTHNSEAKELFEKMPKLEMGPTHELWYHTGNLPFDEKLYNKMKQTSFFQKCSYKKSGDGVKQIIPGSMADYVLNDKVN